MRYAGRFVAENEGGDGICKILVDKKHRNILGVHMLGSYSSEIIWGAAELIENGAARDRRDARSSSRIRRSARSSAKPCGSLTTNN